MTQESIQMRTTSESSGDYRVYAAKGDEPIKGLAVHFDLVEAGDLMDADYIEVEVSEGGAVELTPASTTTATVKAVNKPAIRHAYIEPTFLSQFGDFEFEGESTDLDAVPTIGISGLSASDEDTYEESVSTSAEDAADALFGEGESQDSDEAEAESDEGDEAEEVEVSDDELGIVE